MTISKSPLLAQELIYWFVEADNSDDRFRQIGKLLGYPASATDYYLRRRATFKEDTSEPLPMIIPEAIKGTIHEEFCQFILSPEYWREEVEGYVMPLEKAAKELVPNTYRKMDRTVKRQKLTKKVLAMLRVGESQRADDMKVEYVA
jgi:hypothetical protein